MFLEPNSQVADSDRSGGGPQTVTPAGEIDLQKLCLDVTHGRRLVRVLDRHHSHGEDENYSKEDGGQSEPPTNPFTFRHCVRGGDISSYSSISEIFAFVNIHSRHGDPVSWASVLVCGDVRLATDTASHCHHHWGCYSPQPPLLSPLCMGTAPHCSSLLLTAPYCSSLLLTAPHCSLLLLTAPYFSISHLTTPYCS